MIGIVGRKPGCDIHVKRQQIPNCRLVFSSVQAAQRRGAWIADCRFIERVLKPPREFVYDESVGPRRTHRRHRSGPQLSNDLFPKLSSRRNMREIYAIEFEASSFQALTVTGYTVLIEHSAPRCGFHVLRLSFAGLRKCAGQAKKRKRTKGRSECLKTGHQTHLRLDQLKMMVKCFVLGSSVQRTLLEA